MNNKDYLKSVKKTVVSTSQYILNYLAKDDSTPRQKVAHDKLLHVLNTLLNQAKKQNKAWVCASVESFINDFKNNWDNNKNLAWDVADSQLAMFRNDINRKLKN